MKTKLLIIALTLGFGLKAQTVFFSGFETWGTSSATFTASPTSPTDWMGSKTTSSIVVSQVTSGAEQGASAINVVNTSTTSAVRLTTQPVAITQGKAYQVSYYVKGKGSIRAGLYTGKSTNAGFGYAPYATYESYNSTSWHKFSQSVVADTNNSTTAQFILSIKSTGTTGSITGLDIDSVNITAYTIVPVNLYDIQYTPAANGNSPYYGKMVITGGIVTATYNGSGGTQQGFYVQNSGTSSWSGALVYDYKNIVAQGDSVIFTTAVDEYYNMTELSNVDSASFQIVSHSNTLPTPVLLSTANVNQEKYEGILVTVNNASCSSYTPSYSPAAVIDDGSGATNVDKQIYVYTFVPGTSYNVTGPVNYNYDWSIEPRYAADITVANAIEKFENSLNATLFPNPTTNELNIQLPFVAQKANVSVVDVLGNEVVSAAGSGSLISLKEMKMPAGLYMVKIVADGKSQMVKIIKD